MSESCFGVKRGQDLHKWIVDGDDKDLTGLADLWALHEPWDMGVGASWAYISCQLSVSEPNCSSAFSGSYTLSARVRPLRRSR